MNQFGIADGYHDLSGNWIPTPVETKQMLAHAMGFDLAHPPTFNAECVVMRRGATIPVSGLLRLESGGELRIEKVVPPELPFGYHDFQPDMDQRSVRWIVSPGECNLPLSEKLWGWGVQLYAARSRSSWGMGDLGDLGRLAKWSAELGAGILLINPLFAAAPTLPQQPSPYFSSTRRFRNPLYIRIDDVPGAQEHATFLEEARAAGQSLNESRRIDRDRVFVAKMKALELLWKVFPKEDTEFKAFENSEGEALAQFVAYCCLAEEFGPNWRTWPYEYRRPDSGAVVRFAAARADRARFFAWLQWLLDLQLAEASRDLKFMLDLPIGFEPDGVDAWTWQDLLGERVSVGAPPDFYSTEGQNWGLPPFVPHKLRAACFEPFIQTIRASLRHAGGLRIDHVMGLFRLYWIPWGEHAKQGGYVRYPHEELMAILSLESQRAGAFIVGEDLGMVEDVVRDSLRAHRVLSYKLLWFEPRPPAEYPDSSLAAITTHDLPTTAGLWSGADSQALAAIGREPSIDGDRLMRDKLKWMAGVNEEDSVRTVIVKAHEALSQAPSPVLTAVLEDALEVVERPNVPGTVDEWPNWRIALPVPLEEIEKAELPRKLAEVLSRGAEAP